jgi:hypothetical protein
MTPFMQRLFDCLFSCRHKRLSFPQSPRKGQRRCAAAMTTGTYVVCLDCGKEFAYDWREMRVMPDERESSRPQLNWTKRSILNG